MTTGSLGWTGFMSGDFPSAVRWSVEALEETYRLGDLGTTTISLHVGVLMAATMGQHEAAARLSGAFEALSERYGVRPPAALGRFIESVDPFALARDALAPEAYAAATEAGRRMSLDDAVALIRELGVSAGYVPDVA